VDTELGFLDGARVLGDRVLGTIVGFEGARVLGLKLDGTNVGDVCLNGNKDG